MTEIIGDGREKERNELMASVGSALDQWSHIEGNLTALFDTLVEPKGIYGVGRIVFSNVIATNTRLSIINDLIDRAGLPPFEIRLWRNLYNKIARQAKKRNEIGHFSVVGHHKDGKYIGQRLVPYFSTNAGALSDLNLLTASDISDRAARFFELSLTVFWLTMQIRVLKGQQEANHAPVPRPVLALRAVADRCDKDTSYQPAR